MSKKIFIYLNKGLFISAIVVSLYALINIFLSRRDLPPGVCPVEDFRPWLYLGIFLSVTSFVLSFFEEKKPRKTH